MTNLDEIRGDTWYYRVGELSSESGQAVSDLTHWECECIVKERPEGATLITRSTSDGSIERVEGPAFAIRIDPASTSILTPGSYYMAIALTSPAGVRRTHHRFNLRVAA